MNNFLKYVSDVIRKPLKILINFKIDIEKEGSWEGNLIFPSEINDIIEKDRNILNNFGAIQFEKKDSIIFFRHLMIFSEETQVEKNMQKIKIIFVS